MFYKFFNEVSELKTPWVKSYGRFRHLSTTKLPKGHGAKRKQARKAQRAARKVNK